MVTAIGITALIGMIDISIFALSQLAELNIESKTAILTILISNTFFIAAYVAFARGNRSTFKKPEVEQLFRNLRVGGLVDLKRRMFCSKLECLGLVPRYTERA